MQSIYFKFKIFIFHEIYNILLCTYMYILLNGYNIKNMYVIFICMTYVNYKTNFCNLKFVLTIQIIIDNVKRFT